MILLDNEEKKMDLEMLHHLGSVFWSIGNSKNTNNREGMQYCYYYVLFLRISSNN